MEPRNVLARLAAALLLAGAVCLSALAQAGASPRPSAVSPAQEKTLTAFVDKAADYYAAHAVDAASEKKVLAEFSDPKGAWVKGELYLYAYDLAGLCLAHGYRADLIGRNLMGLQDSDGVFMVKLILAGLEKQSACWLNFRFPNPVKNNKIAPKRSYNRKMATALHPGGIMIGSGIYLE
jgi:signal transduction histidine kinase